MKAAKSQTMLPVAGTDMLLPVTELTGASVGGCGNSGTALAALDDTDGKMTKIYGWHLLSAGIFQAPWSRTDAKRVFGCAGRTRGLGSVAPHRGRSTQQPPAGRTTPATVYKCALSQNSDRAHYPRYSTIRGNFQIVAIYKDFKEISSDNVTTILESPATDSPFSVLQNFPFAGRTISRSNPGYACSQSPVKAQRTVRS